MPESLTQIPVESSHPSTMQLFGTREFSASPRITATITPPPTTPSQSPTRTPTYTASATPDFQLCSPIEGFQFQDLPRIISVGYRPPPKGQDDRHEGVDFCFYRWNDLGPIEGKGVQSVLRGWVAAALDGTFPYGSFVIVETPGTLLPSALRDALKMVPDESLYTLFAHMQDKSLRVSLGEEVSACQVIGAVGRTGNTSAPHLHFETRIGQRGARFTGMSAFTNTATEEEKRNYRLWRISGVYNHFDPMRLLLFGIEPTQP